VDGRNGVHLLVTICRLHGLAGVVFLTTTEMPLFAAAADRRQDGEPPAHLKPGTSGWSWVEQPLWGRFDDVIRSVVGRVDNRQRFARLRGARGA